MATTEQIAIELRVKNQQLANDLKKSEREVKRLNSAFSELGNTSVRVEKQVKSVAKSTGLMANVTKAFVGIAVAGFVLGAARAFSKYASEIQGANNQLRAATNSQAEYKRISAGVLQIANDTGTSFESVANSAARFNRAISTFGGTVDQALVVTDSLSKSLLISGASTIEATAALQQFGQALESGILAGDEFRSLRENAPVAARAIADSLGVTLGELRKLSEQGKLTTDQVAKALIDANKNISEQAAEIPLTLDRAITVANNSFKDFIAENEGLNTGLADIGRGLIDISALLVQVAEDVFNTNTAFSQQIQTLTGLTGPIDLVVRALQGVIAGFYTVGKAIKLAIDLTINFATLFPKLLQEAFKSGAKNLEAFGQLFEDGMIAVFKLDGGKLKEALTEFGLTVGQNIADGLDGVGGVLGKSLADAETDLSEFADGVIAVWEKIGVASEATRIDFNPDGALDKGAQGLEEVNKAAKKLLDTYEKLLKALQDYQTSQLSLPQQAQAQFAALVDQVNKYRDAAKAAGKEVDEALVASVLASGVREREKTLADLAQQWRDIVPPVNEAEAAARRYFDEMRRIGEVGVLLGKSAEEIRAAQQAFADALADEDARRIREAWIEVGKTVIDTFGSAFQAIVDGSVSAKDALRDLLAELLTLLAKAAIMRALFGGSFIGNLGGAILGNGRNGGGNGPNPASGFSGFSGRSSGSTVRIYNQTGGLVSTNKRSNGDVDVMIGNMATAISRGGNSFDQVMRRTYGLQRQGV